MNPAQFFVGDPVPWFTCRSTSNPQFHFDTVAGRYVVLTFFGSASHPTSAEVLKNITSSLRSYFDDSKIAFFGVSVDPDDEREARIVEMLPGIRYFFDFDRKVSKDYGAIGTGQESSDSVNLKGFTLVLDPFMWVNANLSLDTEQHNAQLGQILDSLPPVDKHAVTEICAPILILPRVFEPQFCKELIQLYEKQGGRESGFMREKEGKTVEVKDHGFKRRSDLSLDDAPEYEYRSAPLCARASCAGSRPRSNRARDQEGLPVRGDPDRALHRRLLRRRLQRLLPCP